MAAEGEDEGSGLFDDTSVKSESCIHATLALQQLSNNAIDWFKLH